MISDGVSTYFGEDGQGGHYKLTVWDNGHRTLEQLILPVGGTRRVQLEPKGVPIPMWPEERT